MSDPKQWKRKNRIASCLVEYEHDLWIPIQIRKPTSSEKNGGKSNWKKKKKNSQSCDAQWWCQYS